MRRLPIYFLIDVSESMIGEQIQYVEEGLATIVKELKSDPYALETAWISVIVFAGQARTLVPLQEIISFYPPKFPIGGGTSLSKGLGHLMYELRKNTVTTTATQKGDWKPIVFLFTDGVPTDNTSSVIAEWKRNWQHQTNLVGISFGDENNLGVLKELTDTVLLFKNATPQSYKEFFRWITASIKSSSLSVSNNGTGIELAKLTDESILSKVDIDKVPATEQLAVDTNFAIFSAQCQQTKRPYIIKYKKALRPVMISGMEMQSMGYRLVGAFPVDHTYAEMSSDEGVVNSKVGTDELEGFPTCPCCGNQYGFAVCGCGKVHCIGDEEESTCPSCNSKGKYGFGGGGFDVNRTQG
jgi:uncharacterized protein YegL